MVSTVDQETTESAQEFFDVVVLGGAFSGAALATLLKRERPEARVLILEKSTVFDRKIGESTSEVAGCFLTRVLGLSHYLAADHFQKHGLRMWFTTPENKDADRCSEIGPFSQARFPTYQLDRSKLDQKILDQATSLGCELVRPATVKSMELAGKGKNLVTYKADGQTRTIRAAWVIDASGKAALIARQRGTLKSLDAHPVHSMWVRFRNARDLDCPTSRLDTPNMQPPPVVSRSSATNHLMGRGWWSWIIPLSNGEFSAGVTWDERLCTPPSEGPIGERVKSHLLTHPIGKIMFADAEPVENDARIYKHLPYYSSEVCGDGWIAVGDAAGFMDPLYSQGLDYCSYGICAALSILRKDAMGSCVHEALAMHNESFSQSYHRWFNALYKNKYQYLGDARLMRAAFLLDISTYFVGPVQLVYRNTMVEFAKMPYNGPIGAAFAHFMSFYNQRLEKIARKRLQSGTYGKENLGRRYFVRVPFNASVGALRHLTRGVAVWLSLELESLLQRPAPPLPAPGTDPATETRQAMA
ncbi:MAG: NAD(P)/FAD-dependent oxidoreductase [Akkermansiaceae bacterium]|jgi:flavin-dependent dehydrogenase|nr:NAD(P)/FAD-dependent oxidoreductase [Akkermansiaceae bacterium]